MTDSSDFARLVDLQYYNMFKECCYTGDLNIIKHFVEYEPCLFIGTKGFESLKMALKGQIDNGIIGPIPICNREGFIKYFIKKGVCLSYDLDIQTNSRFIKKYRMLLILKCYTRGLNSDIIRHIVQTL